MKANAMNKLTRSFHKVGFKLKKYSPEILVVAGTVGVVASAVMACKATLKVTEVIDEAKENIEKIHAVANDESKADIYTEEDAKKDLSIVYVQTGIKMVKLYGPAVALGALSLTGILASNNILRKRNIALAAAYATVEKGFKEYRGRVIERFGDRIDYELRHNIKVKEIEKTITDENGEEKTIKETVDTADTILSQYSDYAKFFDVGNPYWEKDPEYNLMFLKQRERYANEKLQSNGFLFLNEVYEMLGIPKTKAGQIVGWIYNKENPVGDNYVDFGIYDIHKQANRDFVNGYERTILLDFNVDGNIWDMM